jgi:multiple sugar transport system permease protein
MKLNHDRRDAALFILPLLLTVGIFILVPVLGTVANSFLRDVTFLPERFIGLANYRALLHDGAFWQALRFTCLFTLVSVPIELVFGMIFALILNQALPGRGLLRVAVLIPWAIPAAISGRAFELIYNYSYGLANFLLQHLGLSEAPVNWLGTGWGAFFAIVVADGWKTTPFIAIILLAGLSAIPEELHQQAMVDRAHFLQRFRRITLPLLKPVLVVALLFRTVDVLRIFDVIFVLTGGGPGGSTNALSLYGYQYFVAGDFGYGSAISVVLFALALVLALLYVRASRFQEELQ